MKIPPKIKKTRYNITLSPEHRAIVENIAERENQTFSRIIEFALEQLNISYGLSNKTR